MTITYRTIKGSELTYSEVDENFATINAQYESVVSAVGDVSLSAASAANSALEASQSAISAGQSADSASSSAALASSSASSAAAANSAAAGIYDQFDDRYLGSKSVAPTTDNDGNPIITGALYWNSTSSKMFVWDGSKWVLAASGTTYYSSDLSSATALAASLSDGSYIIVDRDETRGSVRTRYSVASGLPVSPVTMELDYPTRAVMLASSLSYSDIPAGVRIRTKNENFVYEVAASGASDNHEVTAGGLKLYWIPQFIASPENGRATVALDVKHFSHQGSSPVTSPLMIAGHDYTDASRSMQIDKVGGSIAQASYVMGLRRGSNHILRDDKDGTYVAGCGFMRCSYDTFTESASFTGEISGNVLTVTAMASGSITAGAFILWSGTDNGTTIVAQTSGTTGQEGTYTVALRGTTDGSQSIASQTMTAKTKSEVLAFFIGTTGDIGWSVDRAQFSTGYSGGLYAYTFNAANQTGPIATFGSSSGGVLNVLNNVSGTRTDIVAPANQTSGLRLEATDGPIDIAPASGKAITVRGNINSPSGSNLVITAVGARLDLNASTGVRSLAPFRPGQYNVAGLPAATDYLGHIAFVTNGDSGSPCLAVSNGTNWLRVPLGAAVSSS